MEDNNTIEIRNEVLKRIDFCVNCNRNVTEDIPFCMSSEKPISEMTNNLSLNCPIGKF
jgi:hypothetical protein